MKIEGRKKNALIIGIMWIAAVTIVALLTPRSEATLTLPFLWIPICFFLALMGFIIYFGHYGFLAGFNMMTEEELAVYDMDKITTFMGFSFITLSFILFLTWPLVEIYGSGAFTIMLVVFIFGVIVMAGFANSKRFKKNTRSK
ncbi:hypothetical protein Mpt1_c12960 [Candidatus Methanoplasma termitum]|uniref:Uncharacterized protein n=1 Tax=Candidatus Methanoplasma termitum TaxID=1577791 RepID=A0A0A7LDW4_9ARCH|nr:DUF3784 domain-containing protein [Candidatus Methanoplasma termitum]AIZ57158.1 hypothetical protein Mpt1_c12960 [Candidatus Methanoplasma termitum]MCL2334375.1 DUF3784 domain-containing protein [Candidatus Methanoplasma sp.]